MKPLLLDEIRIAVRAELKTAWKKGLVNSVTTDSRAVLPESLFVALRGEKFDGHDFIEQAVRAGAKGVIVDRNVPITAAMKDRQVCVMQVRNTEEALGQLGRFYRRSLGKRVTIIGLTGSAGKTTTREMLYHVLSQTMRGHRSPKNYNNQIGVPIALLGIEPEHQFAVIEMGTNAPGEIAALSRIAEPDIALITHVGASHLEKLGSVDGVSAEKIGITAGMNEHGVLVCPTDHAGTLERAKALGRSVITFGLEANADVRSLEVHRGLPGEGIRFMTNDHSLVQLRINGLHNVRNALGALAVARRMGLTSGQFAAAVKDFAGVTQRMVSRFYDGITVIDDTYNANPSSVRAAMDELCQYQRAPRRVLILGDMRELGAASEVEHEKLGAEIAGSGVDFLLTVGDQAALTAQKALESGMGRSQVQRAINSRRLARLVKSLVLPGDVILVKGSRAMAMEKVVESLSRYKNRSERVVRTGGIREIKEKKTAGQLKMMKAE